MEIRNLMEELVTTAVDDICQDDAAERQSRYCTSPDCRTDAVCYVLNRMHPRYVSSARGYAHLLDELRRDQQLSVDILRLAAEGLHRVSAVRRGYYDEASAEVAATHGPLFSVPTIKGRVLDGDSFVATRDATVTLLENGQPVAMFDNRWKNPYLIDEHTPGTYIFWPASRPARTVGESVSLVFELRVEAPNRDVLTHHFSVELTARDGASTTISLEHDLVLPDLYLFQG